MADNSSVPVASGNETFANKDIGGVKYPKHIPTDGSGNEIVPATAAQVGGVTETAPASDTASSGLNGRLQRIAQRLTSLIALLPTALGAGGGLKVDGSGTALPVSGTVTANAGTNLNTSALATETTQSAGNTLLGGVTETAPASDTASSGLNGRLQRIAQRISSLIALLPTALGAGGGLKVDGSGTALPVSGTVTVTNFGNALTRGAGAVDSNTQRIALASDSAGIVALGSAGSPPGGSTVMTIQGTSGMTPLASSGYQVTCSTDITRPADTTAYAANDAWADSTSSPASGGFTLTGAARASGGSGVITDIYFLSSAVPGTLLQAEMHIFDAAATAVNDNAAWNLSDADAKLRVAVVPFTLVADANNSFYHAQNLNIGFTCAGSANLRYLIKVKNAYTPASGEVLTVRAKIIQSN
jgi:hypothetical protein